MFVTYLNLIIILIKFLCINSLNDYMTLLLDSNPERKLLQTLYTDIHAEGQKAVKSNITYTKRR